MTKLKSSQGAFKSFSDWTFSIPSTLCPWKVTKSELKEWSWCVGSRGNSLGKYSWDVDSNSHAVFSPWVRSAVALGALYHVGLDSNFLFPGISGHNERYCRGDSSLGRNDRKGIPSRETRIRKGTETQKLLTCSGHGELFQVTGADLKLWGNLGWAADEMEREAFLNQAKESVLFPCKSKALEQHVEVHVLKRV